MQKSKIEWTEFTSNPVRGECPVGCSYCYVKLFRKRYGWHDDIRFYPNVLEVIRKRKKSAKIFVGSTIELFHKQTIQYMPEIMETVKSCPQHRFYLLTKQPQNLARFSPFPDNCFVGVSYTGGDGFTRILAGLKEIKASIKYLSIEPLLNAIPMLAINAIPKVVDWIILGSCTGTLHDMKPLVLRYPDLKPAPYGRKWALYPPEEWIQEIEKAADNAGIAVFEKNNLRRDLNGLRSRKEMPVERRAK